MSRRARIVRPAPGLVLLLVAVLGTCASEGSRTEKKGEPASQGAALEVAFDKGLVGKWRDHGWAPRDLEPGKPASLDLSHYGGWIVGRDDLAGRFRALHLRVKAPSSYGDFLEVSLLAPSGERLLPVVVSDKHRTAEKDGYVDVQLSMSELNPKGQPFSRVQLRAHKRVAGERVLVEYLAFAKLPSDGSGAVAAVEDTGPVGRPTKMAVRCDAPAKPISPLVYGIAYDPRLDAQSQFVWEMKPPARRWGGNPASRFNWKKNAWNTADDWFFRNVNFTGDKTWHWSRFLDANLEKGAATALTVPMMGWVAKDTESFSFPKKIYGAQQHHDPDLGEPGNGRSADGKPLKGDPTRTSERSDAAFVEEWVKQIRALDEKRGKRSVAIYILDNEPMLWNTTHRDVHPEPATYDEVWQKSLAAAKAVKRADPDAFVAGPAVWGWPAYFFSAKDAEAGFDKAPDRKAHGDVPFLEWYLLKMRVEEQKAGKRLLDALTVHFYPQGQNVYGNSQTDPATNALRIRQTRGLWDKSYVDESWIADSVHLIPRMQEIIERRYPGTKLMIDEWSFGGEDHMSGALAIAEALGRFGRHGVHGAFYWTYPKKGSPAFEAFRAYRNYDGQGGRFLDLALPADAPEGASLFASKDERGGKMVLVAMNFSPEETLAANVALQGCEAAYTVRAWRVEERKPLLLPRQDVQQWNVQGTFQDKLPPYSITVYELTRR